jgi:hypothetical protein
VQEAYVTDTGDPYDAEAGAAAALPTLISVSTAFSSRLPSQRVLDLLSRIEGVDFATLAQTQPFRIVAFRALVRDYPKRDPTSLWMHAYEVEVEVDEVNPTNGKLPTPGPVSAASGT